ncbi:MAG: alpha/beta hydrolase family protein [Terriglobales bacterium]
MSHVETLTQDFPQGPSVRGFLHRPASLPSAALALCHGAGGNCRAPLLVVLAEAFCEAGLAVLRFDLPYRQAKSFGPPSPGRAATDREGIKRAAEALKGQAPGRVFLGGISYGGRQTTMLAADDSGIADGLLLLSYPLHPPGRPEQLRTAHLPKLKAPALFVHGTKDPFGAIEEMQAALRLIPAPSALVVLDGVGHDLGYGRKKSSASSSSLLPQTVLQAFQTLFSTP